MLWQKYSQQCFSPLVYHARSVPEHESSKVVNALPQQIGFQADGFKGFVADAALGNIAWYWDKGTV